MTTATTCQLHEHHPTCLGQDSVLGAKLPLSIDACPVFHHAKVLRVSDGGARVHGGQLVWMILLRFLVEGRMTADDFIQVAGLVRSLTSITTSYEIATTELESRIGSVVKQNVQSKVAGVNSFQWATVLRGMTVSGSISFSQAVDLYNAHPDVASYSVSCGKVLYDNDGGGLAVDVQKKTVITFWMDCSSDQLFEFMEEKLNHTSWKRGRQILADIVCGRQGFHVCLINMADIVCFMCSAAALAGSPPSRSRCCGTR